ncbi:major capsid protein [Bacillus wiedmannii]|uniref:major capsid protein n=1 Tax=Bacillus wiedmannii TaxID=1890302 RepID=UPI000BF07C38|nr:phage major capsid protein [Bacillus wiedmannii]PEM08500.1 phage major capsid protein [Bacillus wiedmannii]
MALSLLEASKLSTDVLQKGVIETFSRTSPILEMLPFMEISGNSYKYNIEKTLPTVAFREVNTGYTANEGAVEQKSVGLTILGGDVDVDKFIVATRSNVNDVRAIHTNMKAKALAREYTKTFFHGDSATVANQFDGLGKHVAENPSQDLDAKTIEDGGGKLSLRKLHALLDAVDGGADALFMSKAMRREVQALLEGQQHYIQVGKDAFGRPVEMFGDVQIRVIEDEILPFGPNGGEIYAVKFGAMEYVSGLRNGGVSVRDLGELDTLPVFRTRIEFYCGLAVFRQNAVARLKNVVRGAGTTAPAE